MITGPKLHKACASGNLKEVKRLLKDGVDIHYKNDAGLRWAVFNSHLEIIKLLLDNGANIHANGDEILNSLKFKTPELQLIINNHLLIDKLNQLV
jgi:ankyrin repeat protein